MPDSDATVAAIDFVAGSVCGVANTVVGHPFDTVKVRLQAAAGSETIASCVRGTMAEEGFAGFFRGMASPTATVPLVNAILWMAYGQANAFLLARHTDPGDTALTGAESCAAGAFAGLVNSFVVAPVELAKVRLQNEHSGARYKGPVDVLLSAAREEGVVRGVFRGTGATIVRECPSYVGYFGAYEGLKRLLAPADGSGELSPTRTMICGGLAGQCCWTVSYPQDVVKSYVQLADRELSTVAATKEIWRRSGWRGFWHGYVPCVVRAFPANAAGFLAYEVSSSWMRRTFVDD